MKDERTKRQTRYNNGSGIKASQNGLPATLSSSECPAPLQEQADRFFLTAGYDKIDEGYYKQSDYEALKSDKSTGWKFIFQIYSRGITTEYNKRREEFSDPHPYKQLLGWHIFYAAKKSVWLPNKFLRKGHKE